MRAVISGQSGCRSRSNNRRLVRNKDKLEAVDAIGTEEVAVVAAAVVRPPPLPLPLPVVLVGLALEREDEVVGTESLVAW